MKNYLFIFCFYWMFVACNKSDSQDNTSTPDNNVNIPLLKYVSIDVTKTFQTVEGFGAGIKRRTETLYKLNPSLREKVEAYCFKDLEVNMIRFFVYHDLEPSNDNNDPFSLDESKLNWTRYDSEISNTNSRFIGEALNNAFKLSVNGFDHIIGNCNSAPGWLKTNGQHTNGGTLISGGEKEYSEFLIAFLKGMKTRYNINVTAISPTNEPDFEVTYESMNTTPVELSSILTTLNARLEQASLQNIKILSPECFRVHSETNNSKGTTNYINKLFSEVYVKNAVDVVATHTYADKDHTANWSSLKNASLGKAVWVTESANLKSLDHSMTDAANYAKWIIRGFNEGGMTAYMAHLFYEEADDVNGYAALVAWKNNGDIILPKRYFAFKHFTNLIKPGFKRIETVISNTNIFVSSFISIDGKQIVMQVFNDSGAQNISFEIPEGSKSILHYNTTNSDGEDFLLNPKTTLIGKNNFFTIDIADLSMHSFVFNL